MADTMEEENRWADDAEVRRFALEFIRKNRERLERIGWL